MKGWAGIFGSIMNIINIFKQKTDLNRLIYHQENKLLIFISSVGQIFRFEELDQNLWDHRNRLLKYSETLIQRISREWFFIRSIGNPLYRCSKIYGRREIEALLNLFVLSRFRRAFIIWALVKSAFHGRRTKAHSLSLTIGSRTGFAVCLQLNVLV